MGPRLRKFVLTAHVISSVGWLGAVFVFLALDVVAVAGRDIPTVRAAYVGMDLTTKYVLIPLAFSTLLIGIVQALGTPWGLVRHYWVLFKLVLTGVGIFFLLNERQMIGYRAEVATSVADPRNLPPEFLHPGGGLLVLLLAAVLAVYKPRGMTPYGRRKQQEQRRAKHEQRAVAMR